MDGGLLLSIGELAQRTGLPVKTIRFYSDRGIVAPTDRSRAGYRRYDVDAVARLDLVRTLRDLGLDLATIRKVVERELTLGEVARVHAEALRVQIRTLSLQRAVLMAVADRDPTTEETALMHQLATLSQQERRRLIDDFLDASFGGLGADPRFAAITRTMTPELPDNPDPEQVAAWVELAELAQDPGFRAGIRQLVESHAVEGDSGMVGPQRDLVAVARDLAAPALAAGVEPASPQASEVIEAITAHFAQIVGRPADDETRRLLLIRLRTAHDPRRERYLELLAVINDWPRLDSLLPVLDWSIHALEARTR